MKAGLPVALRAQRIIAAREAATELTHWSIPNTRNCDAYLVALDVRSGTIADARDRLNAIAGEQHMPHELDFAARLR